MTKRIIVISDTHMPRKRRELPAQLVNDILGADLLIHLGDFDRPEAVDYFSGLAPLVAVHGNNDPPEVAESYPARAVLTITGHRLALLHGHLGGRTALGAARAVRDADVVLFGHSHQPYSAAEAGRLLLNPGSPTERRWGPHRSYARLEIGNQVEAEIVTLE